MNSSVKVSIVMGVCNPKDKKRFYMALQSLIFQSFEDWECILYDDGSQEPYASMIRKASQMDERFRYFRGSRNRGLGYALNQCIRHARGKFIARMDDDDYSKSERLSCQVRFLEMHPRYHWVGSNAELMDRNGVWGYQKMPQIPGKREFLFNSPYIHPSVMFRREVLEEAGGYCASREILQCEDYELFMRLHAKGYRGYNIQKALLNYWADYDSVKKRTYRRRIREMKVRCRGFGELGMLNRRTVFYVGKPLLVGAVPEPVHHYIRRLGKAGYPKWKTEQGNMRKFCKRPRRFGGQPEFLRRGTDRLKQVRRGRCGSR